MMGIPQLPSGSALPLDDDARQRLAAALTETIEAVLLAVRAAQQRDGFLVARDTRLLVASVQQLITLSSSGQVSEWVGYTPAGGSPGLFAGAQTRLGVVPEQRPVPAPTPALFSESQQTSLASTVLDATLSILDTIRRESTKTEFDAVRNIAQLTASACRLVISLGLRPTISYPFWDDDDDDDDDFE